MSVKILTSRSLVLYTLHLYGYLPTVDIIKKSIEQHTKNSIYTALYSLQKEGYLTSELIPIHGRQWRFWELTEKGEDTAHSISVMLTRTFSKCEVCGRLLHQNRCVVCKRVVCDDCYTSIEACKDCCIDGAESERMAT